MPNVVVEEGQFNRMLKAAGGAIREWNARRPAGEAEAIEVYRGGNKAQGLLSFAGAQAPVLQPILAGAVIYAVVTSAYFDKLELLKAHWSLKALLVLCARLLPLPQAVPVGPSGARRGGDPVRQGVEGAAREGQGSRGPGRRGRRTLGVGPPRLLARARGDWRAAEHRAQLHSGQRAAHNAERLADRIFEHARAA